MAEEEETIDLFGDMHPYSKLFEVHKAFPKQGVSEEEILREVEYMASQENEKWLHGQCSGTMYHGGMEHYAFLNKVFSSFSHVNILQRDMCPSATKFESEVLSMVGKMLHGGEVGKVNRMDEEAGAVTSCGSESIYNAMYVYREWGRDQKGITAPEVVAPVTIHPAPVQAAHYLGSQVIRVP